MNDDWSCMHQKCVFTAFRDSRTPKLYQFYTKPIVYIAAETSLNTYN